MPLLKPGPSSCVEVLMIIFLLDCNRHASIHRVNFLLKMAGVSWHRIIPRLFVVATYGIITIMPYKAVHLGFVASLLDANVSPFP